MSALVIDTSTWIDYFGSGHRAEVIEDALKDGRAYLPPIVAAELTSGNLAKSDLAELTSLLEDLPICHAPLEHWFRVGELRRRLFAVGEAISTPDAHVAQCALDLGASLVSEDGVFERIAGTVGLRLI